MCKCQSIEMTAIKSAIYGLVSNLMKDDYNMQMILIDSIAYWSATMIGNWLQRYYTIMAEKRGMSTDVYGICVCQIIRQLVMIAAKQIMSYLNTGMMDKNMFMQDMMLLPILENGMSIMTPPIGDNEKPIYSTAPGVYETKQVANIPQRRYLDMDALMKI